MTTLRIVASRVLALFTRQRQNAELNDEIQAHLDLLTEEHIARGLPSDAARAAARREFGGVEQVKEIYRDRRGLPFVEAMVQDVRFALRTVHRNPGFFVVVVLSLSLGIGVNSAIFSVLNALMLRPLPVRSPNELFLVVPQGVPRLPSRFSYPAFNELRAAVPPGSLAGVSRVARMYGVIEGDQEARPTAVQLVSGEYFSVLGVSASAGRLFTPADNQTLGSHPVAVISDGFWVRALGAAPDVVGRRLTLNSVGFTIVGVGAPGFSGVWLESPADVWIPLMMQGNVHYAQNFSSGDDANDNKPWIPQEGIRWLDVIGRSTPGEHSVKAAIATTYQQIVARAAERIGDPERRRRFMQQFPVFQSFGQGFSNLRARFEPPLFALLGMAMLILLIACANTVNLLLARAARRQREIAVRLAIGASRGRLIRQLVTESLVIVIAATAVGLLLAGWAGNLLVRQTLGTTGSAPFTVDVDGRVLVFTIGIAAFAVLVFGLSPAFRMMDVQLGAVLTRSGARIGAAQPRLQKFLVAFQVALSVMLMTGAGLFVQSLRNYAGVDLGFAEEHVLSVWISPQAAGYPATGLLGLYRNLIARVESVPGVTSASVAMCGLASDCRSTSDIAIEGYQPAAGELVQVLENRIGPRYFSTTGMRLVQGRDFNDHDTETAPKVAIVNRAVIRRFFGSQTAIGRRFGYRTPDIEIVGIVEDARTNNIQESPVPMAFYPITQPTLYAGSLEVRVIGDPRSIVTDVRRAVTEVDAGVPIDRVTILSEQVRRGLNQERLVAGLTSVFGMLALGLACFGLFGVLSYAVAQRTHEIGIRLALGAESGAVRRMVLGDALRLVAGGLAFGVPLAVAAAASLRTLLFDVAAFDSVSVVSACAVLIGAALLASYVPARRASRVDPMVALRCE